MPGIDEKTPGSGGLSREPSDPPASSPASAEDTGSDTEKSSTRGLPTTTNKADSTIPIHEFDGSLDPKSPHLHGEKGGTSSSSVAADEQIELRETYQKHPSLEDGRAVPKLKRKASSFTHRRAVMIPRSERRGLLGRFAIVPEVINPYEYNNATKWIITAVVALASAAAPMGSSMFYPSLPDMSKDMHVSTSVTNLTIAGYMLSMAIFPLWWSSFSETFGRRTIYITSFTLFTVASVLSAVSVNIAMLIVTRVIAGGASASVQAVGAGTIADIWVPAERGRAMGLFYLGPLTGPLIAPIIGGVLSQKFNWRATMWFLTIYGGVMTLGLLLGLPETLARKTLEPRPASRASDTEANDLRRVSTAKSIKNRLKKTAFLFKKFITDPLAVILYLRYPAVSISVYMASIAFGALFVMNISLQSTFAAPPYEFPTILLGLLYLSPATGYVIASLVGGRWIDYIMKREAKKANRYDDEGKLIYLPEDRMGENLWLAASLYPASLIWYGWAVQYGLPWYVSQIATFFFGIGAMLVFGCVTTVLTEFMPHSSSSGVAVNNLVRNIFSCVGGTVAQPLIDAMGNGWLCTMVGLIAWITCNLAILALKKKGPKWRVTMDRELSKR